MTDDRSYFGKQIGGSYRITAEIASGSFGGVFLGKHIIFEDEPIVAIKLLHAHLRSQEELAQFIQEAQVLKKLKHPHILRIIDAGIQEGIPYIVTEYAPGGSLRDRLQQLGGKLLPLDEAITILSQIGNALQYTHQQQPAIVHRDLKPENILFNVKGEAVLADFGIAAALSTAKTKNIGFGGTLAYMAPEQFEGTVSIKSDQYALGCIAFLLMTGRKPFIVPTPSLEAMWYQHAMIPPIAPRQLNPQLPINVEQAILKAMAKQRADRHADILTFVAALNQSSERRLNVGIAVNNPERFDDSSLNWVKRQREEAVHLVEEKNVQPLPGGMQIEVLGERYQLQSPIVQGSRATIYRGMDRRMNRVVAVKVLREAYSTDPKFVTRFQREARAASALHHPNIVQVYDYGQTNGNYFIVMELIEGVSLRRYLGSRGGILDIDRAVIIAHDIALGLGAAHRRGIVHRDVKPQNVLVGRDGSIKLTDFGIASVYKDINPERLTPAGGVLGTPCYFAPEQAQGEIVKPAADVYALGIVMYEMLIGRPPFDGGNPITVAIQHIQEKPTPPSYLNPHIPPAMEEIIMRCLEKTPEKRFPDGNALARALELLGETE